MNLLLSMPGAEEWIFFLFLILLIGFVVIIYIRRKSQPTNDEVIALIKGLDELKNSGAISEIEYTKRKSELLKRIKL